MPNQCVHLCTLHVAHVKRAVHLNLIADIFEFYDVDVLFIQKVILCHSSQRQSKFWHATQALQMCMCEHYVAFWGG